MSDQNGPSGELPDYGRLLDAYITGEATEAELQQLFDYIRDHPAAAVRPLVDASRRSFDDVARDPQLTARFDPVLSAKMLDRLLTGIHATPVVPMHRPWRRLAVAAAVIGLLGIGAWWLVRQSPAPSTAVVTVTQPIQDVLPGGDKAVLTLGNGAKILLDSAATGVVAQQGSATVQKLANGRLAYTGGVGGEAPHIQNARTPQADAHIVYNTLSTPRGGQYQLRLSDGTKVWLNAASSITYPTAFTGPDRSVTITGEAYFEATHIAAHPFRVHAGSQTIEDIGTAFNVNAYADEPEKATTLVEGAIRIGPLVLRPGEAADQDPDGRLRLVRNADVEQALAWKNGLFRLRHTSLSQILRDVARWYDVEVVDSSKRESYFSGVISRDVKLSGVLQLLQSNGAQFKIEGRKVIVK